MSPPRTLSLHPSITRLFSRWSLSFSSSSGSDDSLSDSCDSDPVLVSSVASVLIHRRSKSRWSTLLSLYPQGFTPHQVSQILLQIRNNPRLALRFFQFTLHNSLSSHSLHSYSTMIHILARARLKTHARSLIKAAIRFSESIIDDDPQELCAEGHKIFVILVQTYRLCDSAPFVFDLLIQACLELNRIDTCIKIVQLLRSRGICPNVCTCNSLIASVSKNRGCHFGYDLYEEIFRSDDRSLNGGFSAKILPNVQTFNCLLLSFYQTGSVDMVEQVWVEMGRMNCKPNLCSYNILMAAYCDEGELGKTWKLWEEMKLEGLKQDVVAYNTLIGGYCKTGEIERGEELHTEMGLYGIESTCVTYQHLINGYCKIGNVHSAMLLYEDMRRKGFSPDSSTIDTLVRAFCSKAKISEALDLFRIVTRNANFVARKTTYVYLLKGLCRGGQMNEAHELQAEMVGKGLNPDSDIYCAFIDGYTNQGKPDIAELLRKEMAKTQAWPNGG
ncbi:hypothetical protein Nepgr_004577 [Nepenthes gracilis]|uniref:Pentatricopeptide repeat-containing protein n=1 Tax=Nepenthes gracilis TaxID=150966 RepID=A0AAD3S1K5_NEPGR|nr:hypothetical protein Nepgr_004577 [Nepenthes gracilis]